MAETDVMDEEPVKLEKFPFFRSYYLAIIEDVPENEQLEALKQIIEFGLDGREPELRPGAFRAAWRLMRVYIQNSRAYAINGQKGGKANRGKPKANAKQNQSEAEGNVKQYECEYEYDYDAECDSEKADSQNQLYSSVIEYLNEKAGTKYKATTGKTKKLIHARIAEGFTLEDFRTVIDRKCADWLPDAKMAAYLRPETLFGTKFEGYLNAGGKDNGEKYTEELWD